MIVVRVELHSAITGHVSEIARAHISNTGGTAARGDYQVTTLRGRSTDQLNRHVPQRRGKVTDHARLTLHVWHLVAKALSAVGYGIVSSPRSGEVSPSCGDGGVGGHGLSAHDPSVAGDRDTSPAMTPGRNS